MFCPTCGVEAAQGLRYCKQCGANLNAPAASEPPPRRFPPIVIMTFLAVMGFITALGLGLPLAASSDLKNSGFSPRDIIGLFSIGAIVTLALDAMLVWLMLKLIKIYQPPQSTAQTQEARPPALREFMPPQLSAPPSAIGSVTEHTTRNFDQYEEVIRARKPGRDTNEV